METTPQRPNGMEPPGPLAAGDQGEVLTAADQGEPRAIGHDVQKGMSAHELDVCTTFFRSQLVRPPIDLLLCILHRLELPQALAFASVCTTWRSTAVAAGVPSSSAPWLMSWADLLKGREKRGRCSSAVTCNFHHLLDVDKAYGVSVPHGCFVACCGASHGWLVLVNEISNLVLYNPFTTATIHLPPITDFAFYAVTFHGMVEQWDIDGLNGATRKVVVAAEIHAGPILSRHLLSTSWGDLLQVHAHLEIGYPDGIRFQIHKINP
nr:unnamed protein product [Digitaria exilis]